jgi:branched-chain amino acid aminotransferase
MNPFAPRPELKVWMDGEIVPVSEAKVCVFDHGLLYGDGVFEGIRVYGGRIFKEQEHIRRLYESAKAIRLDIPISPEQMMRAMYDTIAANGTVDGYIRLLVTRGVGLLGISVTHTACPSIIIICDRIALYQPDVYERGLHCLVSSLNRNHVNTTSPRVKSLNYLNNVMAKLEAKEAGADEAILLTTDGFVSECSGDNIFLVRDGQLSTPPTCVGILEGVTRGVVFELAQRRGIAVQERLLVRHDLYIAEEAFASGTAAEIIAITKIDNRLVGDGCPGPITRMLAQDFAAYRAGK